MPQVRKVPVTAAGLNLQIHAGALVLEAGHSGGHGSDGPGGFVVGIDLGIALAADLPASYILA